MSSEGFFADLAGFTGAAEIANLDNYTDVPEGWLIVITDVEGSTKAIEEGKYREVNLVGASSIAAVHNAVGRLLDLLRAREEEGLILFGHHTSDRAMLTCLVHSRHGRHLHFVDGADGGYALAAQELKAKLRS